MRGIHHLGIAVVDLDEAIATYERLYGISCVALRFFTVYGPRQRPDLAIAKFTELIERGRPIPVYGDGSARRDFTYIEDILQGVRAAMDRCRGFVIYNLGYPIHDIAVYYLPPLAVLAIWAALGAGWLVTWVARARPVMAWPVAAALVLAAAFPLAAHWRENDQRRFTLIERYVHDIFRAVKPGGVLFCSNPRGDGQEGWQGERYGAWHDLPAWRQFMSAAGFLELEHYYRPEGLPREQQPWLASVWRRPA